MKRFSLASYTEGIHRAHAEGRITYADHYTPESGAMQYSNHISWEVNGVYYEGGLSFTNTRSLFHGIRRVMGDYRGKSIHFFELGPGAGNACYELHCIARTMHIDVEIHTASYTPVNPYMPLLRAGDELLAHLSSSRHLKILEQNAQGCSWYIRDTDLFRMPDEKISQICWKAPEKDRRRFSAQKTPWWLTRAIARPWSPERTAHWRVVSEKNSNQRFKRYRRTT